MAIALATTACSGASRSDVLTAVAQDTIVPSYEDLAEHTEQLHSASVELCSDPNETTLGTARAALSDARHAWSITEPFWVGPVMERRSWAVIDWPVSPDEIDDLLNTGDELTPQRIGTRIGADQRGLGGVEYILGSIGDSAVTVALLARNERRCEYLTGVTEVISAEASLLPKDWTESFEGGDPFIRAFTTPEEEHLDDLVNDVVFLLEAMTDGELGSALGEMNREADLDAIVEGPLGLASEDLSGHLVGLRMALIGSSDGGGLGDLLDSALTTRLTTRLDAADAAVAAIRGPLRESAAERSVEVVAARAALKELQITVNTELVSALGVTIGFSDADGDTG